MTALLLIALCSPADWLAKLRPAPPPPVVVQVDCPGHAPVDLEALVARPLERSLQRLAGLARVESVAREGQVRLTLTFERQVPQARAAQRTREAVTAAQPELPADCQPLIRRTSDAEVWRRYAFPNRGPADRARAATIAQSLERFAGVTQVQACGLTEARVTVTADPKRLAAVGLTLADLAAPVRDALSPGGRYALAVPRTPDPKALADARLRGGLRLSDVAQIRAEDVAGCRCEVGGRPAVCLTVRGRGGAPIKLDEAVGGARPLPLRASRVEVRLASPQPAAVLSAVRSTGHAQAQIEVRETTAHIRLPPAGRPALARALRALPGVAVVHTRDPGEPVSVVWVSGPRDALERATQAVRAALRARAPGRAIEDPTPPSRPELSVTLRPEGRQLGITSRQLARAVRDALHGIDPGHPAVHLSLAPKPDLMAVQLTTPSGARVPLAAVAEVQRTRAPAAAQRADGRPSRALWVVGATPGQLRPALDGAELPAGVVVQVTARP